MDDRAPGIGSVVRGDLLTPPQARQLIAEQVAPGPVIRIATKSAHGHVLATSVAAPVDLPRFRNAAMDGYSVSAQSMVQANGTGVAVDARPIATGQRVPDEADTVVPFERATEIGHHQIQVSGQIEAGTNVRLAGEELHVGESALEAGSLLGPAAIGLLAALGVDEVEVIRPPRVGLLITGDELRYPGRRRGEHMGTDEIGDANGPMLRALVGQAGGRASTVLRNRDNPSAISASLAKLATRSDLILTSGGASVGRRDHVARALDEDGQIVMRQLAVRPGRPTSFGFLAGTPVVVLPGNPLALLVGFEMIGRPALRRLGGHQRLGRPVVTAYLDSQLDIGSDFWEAVPVRLRWASGDPVATPTALRRSGMLSGAAIADGLVLLGPATALPGRVEVELWSG